MHSDPGDENDFGAAKTAHHNLSPAINAAIINSEVEGGAWLDKLPVGKALRIFTQNSTYTLRKQQVGYRLDQTEGHKLSGIQYPVVVQVNGSTWGGSMIKVGFVGRGMRLECQLPSNGTLTTSTIREIEEIE